MPGTFMQGCTTDGSNLLHVVVEKLDKTLTMKNIPSKQTNCK